MKKVLSFAIAAALAACCLEAQTPEHYAFKEVKMLSATPVKSQDKTGTCWSFSTTSFLESEVLRTGKGEHNLSEMFTVRHIYRQKCENYVRRMGKANLSEGGLAHDKFNAVRQYGVVPESAYPGRKDLAQPYNHKQIEKSLQSLCDTFVAQVGRGELRADWLSRVDDMLDAEFGPVPLSFVYNNIQFSPSSFREYLGINPDNYVSITSFSHHPFWSNFVLEVPDNFSNGQFFNMPLNDLMRCLNHSLQKGFSVEWDTDVSNPGFSGKNGLAVAPEADWATKSRDQIASTFQFWEPERLVTQQLRQQAFDRLETQDDHLMHITGVLNETQGGLFYAVKNSWGEISERKGFVYVSDAYMRLNTISFSVNKNALPLDIRQQMGLEFGMPSNSSNAPRSLELPSGSDAKNTPTPPGKFRIDSPEMKAMPGQRMEMPKERKERIPVVKE
ncbi:MAG: C1 family peptidase [Saprospiraceae bacterium]